MKLNELTIDRNRGTARGDRFADARAFPFAL